MPEFVRFIDQASYICISLIAVASLDISIGDAGQHPSDLALPHYDTCDVSAITNLPYMVVSHDLGQCAIPLSQLENMLLRVLEPLTS